MLAEEKLGDETESAGPISGRAQHAQKGPQGRRGGMTRKTSHRMVLLGWDWGLTGLGAKVVSRGQTPEPCKPWLGLRLHHVNNWVRGHWKVLSRGVIQINLHWEQGDQLGVSGWGERWQGPSFSSSGRSGGCVWEMLRERMIGPRDFRWSGEGERGEFPEWQPGLQLRSQSRWCHLQLRLRFLREGSLGGEKQNQVWMLSTRNLVEHPVGMTHR